MNLARPICTILVLLLYSLSVTATPVPRESPDGLFVDDAVECAVVVNQGVDTMAEALAADGTTLMRMATWRGREGRYIVAPPADSVELRIIALGRDSISVNDVQVDRCPEALGLNAASAMAKASDLRLTAYFGGESDSSGIEAAFSEALAGLPANTLPGWRADVLFETAEWHRDSGQAEQAAVAWSNALDLYRTVGNARGEAAALNSLGLAAWRQGRPHEAVLHFDQALTIRQTLGEAFASAAILNNLGLLAAENGDREAALAHYQQALSIFQSGIELRIEIDTASAAMLAKQISTDGDLGSALNTLNNLAQLYRDTGQSAIAERYWRNYLAFEAHLPEAMAVAQARHNLGVLMFEQGRLDEALRLLLDAKARFDAAEAGRWQAESRVALSLLYLQLGDQDGAWGYAEQAMALEMDDRRARASVLSQAGRIALDLGHAEAAFEAFQTAASLLDTNAPPIELDALDSDLARAELALGNLHAARVRQEHNLQQLEPVGFPAATARARSLLGEILYRQGEIDAAINALEQAQAVQQRIGTSLAELETLERLGRIQQETNPSLAISTNERALNLLEDPRVRSLPEMRRAGFRAVHRELYERQIALLLNANQPDVAWAIGERARDFNLIALREDRQRDEQLAVRGQTLDQHAELLAELQVLTSLPNRNLQDIQRIRAMLDRLEVDLQPALNDTYTPSLEAAHVALAPNQRLLSFVLGEDQGWVWVIGGSHDHAVAIDDVAGLRADVESLLAQLRHPRNAIGRISRLVEAIRNRLPSEVHDAVADAEEILIQPDRELHALPFALLWLDADPGYHVPRVRRVISATTSAATSAMSPSSPTLLVLADPGWNESEYGEPLYPESSLLNRLLRDSALARLPGTRREAEAIAALDGDIHVQLKLGRAATRDFVLEGGLASYPLLHIATHGLVDLDYPELSALLLADKTGAGPAFLRPADIARLNLNASLVVLSGCDTGQGRVFAGSGAFSLARPFLLAGANQVLASLWKIDDYRTAQFMTRFYQYLLTESKPPEQALSLTQQWMRQQPGSTHPYYWAGFILTTAEISYP